MSWGYYDEYREYVPVAQKKAQAQQYARRIAKREGRELSPVSIEGTKIAKTFWGKAWCDHLASFSDFANRLPRGRTYIRNGSVVDLQITPGRLEAIVAGSEPYKVKIEIKRLKPAQWKKVRDACAASIDSLLDLLSGRFSDGVMQRLTDRHQGLFPTPGDIHMACSCPDWATMCKHVAAVLYGVGAHLDNRPELLFVLRDVDPQELVSDAVAQENLSAAFGEPSDELAGEDLGSLFGIELDTSGPSSAAKRASQGRRSLTKQAGRKKIARAQSPKKPAKPTPAKSKSAVDPKSAVAKARDAVTKKIKNSKDRKSAKRVVLTKSPKKKPAEKKSSPKKSPRKKATKATSTTRPTREKRATDATS